MRSTRQQARFAGLLYILMCVTGLPGLPAAAATVDPGSAASTTDW